MLWVQLVTDATALLLIGLGSCRGSTTYRHLQTHIWSKALSQDWFTDIKKLSSWERWLCLPKRGEDLVTKLLTRKFPPPPLDVPFRLRLPLLPPSPAPSTLLPLQSVAAAVTADSLCLTLCRSRLNRWRQMTITSYWSQHRQDRQLRQWHNHSTTHFHDSSTSTSNKILNSLFKFSIL